MDWVLKVKSFVSRGIDCAVEQTARYNKLEQQWTAIPNAINSG
jgi:hypothetical protein